MLCLAAAPAMSQRVATRDEWKRFFADEGVEGTVVVVDMRVDSQWVYNTDRARERFSPASTFKVPHALFALDAGVVKNEFQRFRWDGQRRAIEAWNADQDLRSSMRHSVVWLYQQWARAIGAQAETRYLRAITYGNMSAQGAVDLFWLNGTLRISALEQVDFLRRLYTNALPFRVEHQRLVKDVMLIEAGRDWRLRAKTGWQSRLDTHVGWWVGWVEWPEGPVFFALNIDMPRGGDDTPKRESIGRAILRSIKALPDVAPGK